jgi:radical SAM superfamily enzyme YgiQ (UPF0313 family)
MHLHFVFPRWRKLLEDHVGLREVVSGYDVGNFRMAGLGVAAAAGAVPAEHTVSLVDENVADVVFDVEADLVCLGFFTPQATNAYQLADSFRRAGKTVIGGGLHPTVIPEDASPHFDAILRGPAEGAWEQILADVAGGTLQPVYAGNRCAPFARPRRDLFKNSGYLQVGIVQTARGCVMGCPFCVLPTHAGTEFVFRPVAEVLEDIATLAYPCFFFADENLLFPDPVNRDYRMELFSQLVAARNRRISFIAAYPQFVRQLLADEIGLMGRAKLQQIYLVLGLKQSLAKDLQDSLLMAKVLELKAAGIEVMASFNLGNDEDAAPVEEGIAAFCAATRTNLAEFIIHTPFPGTPMFTQMEKAGRLLTKDWSKYNGANVVFSPLHETPDALLQRYLGLWRMFYSDINQDQVAHRYARAFGGSILRQPPVPRIDPPSSL